MPEPITVYSTQWCGYCHRLMGQLTREGIAFKMVDIEQVADAAALVEKVNRGDHTVPTVVFDDGSAMTNPSLAEVKQKLAG